MAKKRAKDKDSARDDRDVFTRAKVEALFRRRAHLISSLLPLREIPSNADIDRLFGEFKDRLLGMMKPGAVTLMLYKSDALRGLLYTALMRYTDVNEDCFPPGASQVPLIDDTYLLKVKFSNDMDYPRNRLCIVTLGNAARNRYLSEVINEFARFRSDTVKGSRTILLFQGTRQEFRRCFGGVSQCTLDRDASVIDLNAKAELQTNEATHTSEDVFSRSFEEDPQSFAPNQPYCQSTRSSQSAFSVKRGSTGAEFRKDGSLTTIASSPLGDFAYDEFGDNLGLSSGEAQNNDNDVNSIPKAKVASASKSKGKSRAKKIDSKCSDSEDDRKGLDKKAPVVFMFM